MKKKVQFVEYFESLKIPIEKGFVKSKDITEYFKKIYPEKDSQFFMDILGFSKEKSDFITLKSFYHLIDEQDALRHVLKMNSNLLNPNFHRPSYINLLFDYWNKGNIHDLKKEMCMTFLKVLSPESVLNVDPIFYLDLENLQKKHNKLFQLLLNQLQKQNPEDVLLCGFKKILFHKKEMQYLKNIEFLQRNDLLDFQKMNYDRLSFLFNEFIGVFSSNYENMFPFFDMKKVNLTKESLEKIKTKKIPLLSKEFFRNQKEDSHLHDYYVNMLKYWTDAKQSLLLTDDDLYEQMQTYNPKSLDPLKRLQLYYQDYKIKKPIIELYNSIEFPAQDMTAEQFLRHWNFFTKIRQFILRVQNEFPHVTDRYLSEKDLNHILEDIQSDTLLLFKDFFQNENFNIFKNKMQEIMKNDLFIAFEKAEIKFQETIILNDLNIQNESSKKKIKL